jgi:hypothetical protein
MIEDLCYECIILLPIEELVLELSDTISRLPTTSAEERALQAIAALRLCGLIQAELYADIEAMIEFPTEEEE